MEASCAKAPCEEESDAVGELRFSVFLVSGERMIVSMMPTESVRMLKRRIEEMTSGTRHTDMRIIAGTSVLSNRQTMAQVCAQYGDCLQLIKLPPAEALEIRGEGEEGDGEVILLDEHMDQNYEPTEDEVDEYSEWLGMDPDKDQAYLWIAKEGLKCPTPDPWRVCQAPDGKIFYFNLETSESQWDHPLDEYCKQLYEQLKSKSKKRIPVPASVRRLRLPAGPLTFNWSEVDE
eukprot:gnl/TRDRNA2_/TRDRNA2_57783_c0_seq1.p1 gnl/TRDRNA2_/TRDRNA2_57783_c0~~gnl/TRDRNA2_/TRDRNA2_57783_c0_seq1.p1  ORF type:complete len:233 (+),score=44.38 gnl/TRDRNA2_/TRDRNA2_57783_c0_seq1:111-809(+)